MSDNFKRKIRNSRKRKYNPHEPTTFYTLVHLEWQSECGHLNTVECCGDIARREEYDFANVQRKRRKFEDVDDDISEDVDSEPDSELDEQLASCGLLSEASIIGMQKVKRMELHRSYMKRKRQEELRQVRLDKNRREANRSQRVQARADRRQQENAAKQARQKAIQRVMKKEKSQAKYDKAATKVNIRFRGGKQCEEYYSYDDYYEEDFYDDDDYYDDDYNYYEEESYQPYNQPVCLVGDDVLSHQKDSQPEDANIDYLEQALLNSLQDAPDEEDEIKRAMEVSVEEEEFNKALEASLMPSENVDAERDEIEKAIQASLAQNELDANVFENEANMEDDEALARALHEQLNFSEEVSQQSRTKEVWNKPPKAAEQKKQRPKPFPRKKDVWGRPKTLAKSMAPSGGIIPVGKGKKLRAKGKKKPPRSAEEEELAYNLALIASMEQNSALNSVVDDEPIDVIDIDETRLNSWSCAACTYLNGRGDLQCLMCGTSKQSHV